MSDTVILTQDWVQAEDHLIAAYAVENRTAGSIVVFDRLFLTLPTGQRVVEPDRAYVTVTSESVLRVEKVLAPLPLDRDVESPEVPYVRVLAPGAKLEGRAVVMIPILTLPPYGRPATGAASERARTAVFRIGYAVVDDAASAVPIGAPDDGVWSVPFAWATTRQQMLQGPLIEIDLGVVRPLPALMP